MIRSTLFLGLLIAGCPKPEPTPVDPPARQVDVVTAPGTECATNAPRTGSAKFVPFVLDDATPAREPYVYGGGIAAGDFDGNGTDEIVTARDGVLEYVEFTGSAWAPKVGMPDVPMEFAFGALASDLDEDGDLDVLITRWGRSNHVLLNDGSGRFAVGPALPGSDTHHSTSATAADFDGDGDLDLFIGGHGFVDEENADPTQFAPGDPSLLLLGDGTGGYSLAEGALPEVAQTPYTFLGGAIDFDGDGDLDLLTINDFGRRFQPGRLLWNDGNGVFEADNNAVGLDLAVAGMGLGVAELNGDGIPDVLVPFWAGYAHLLSVNGIWADFTAVTELHPSLSNNQTVGWGAMFGDLDNDGGQDAVVMHGFIETNISQNTPTQPDALFERSGDTWENRTQTWGQVDTGDNRGLVLADFNHDGWLDYARPDLSGPTAIYMGRCGDPAWLEVALTQDGTNAFAIGAAIEVRFEDRSQWRYVTAGGLGYGSSAPPEVHFGLARAETVDVRITWPDGQVTEIDDVQTRHRLAAHRR